ncbi:hypothetical protein CEXT_665961 [Caerostris extrusa]|uniref:Uncharacterized protein n=1 Tax=Caerostris extrusa TaxID=172846 RepID=A0AAV4VAP0_CAEEX|nr:hypothetical protein CEXT_665961 [Caerostris extrusa]
MDKKLRKNKRLVEWKSKMNLWDSGGSESGFPAEEHSCAVAHKATHTKNKGILIVRKVFSKPTTHWCVCKRKKNRKWADKNILRINYQPECKTRLNRRET